MVSFMPSDAGRRLRRLGFAAALLRRAVKAGGQRRPPCGRILEARS